MRLLNPGYSGINGSLYYNRGSGTCYKGLKNATVSCNFTSSGLNSTAKSMIENAKYYLGGYNGWSGQEHIQTPVQVYSYERKIKNTKDITFIRRIQRWQ